MNLTPAQNSDCPTLCRLISLAFGSPLDKVQGWLDEAGVDNFRVMREVSGGPVVSCALRVPMGHYFGGKRVAVMGVAGVAVAPEVRGRGLATQMMELLLREVRAEGVPTSSLYPATLPLYRRVGYEQAGYWFEYRAPLHRIQLDKLSSGGGAHSDARLTTRAYDPVNDREAIGHCYHKFALQHEGMLDRGDYMWGRIFKPRQGETTGLVVVNSSPAAGGSQAGEIEAYVFFRQERNPDMKIDVHVTDIAATTPAAGRRLLDMLSDFRSVGNELIFNGGPLHPLVPLLDEQKIKLTLKEYWMLRITDVAGALTARGYNPHVTTDFTLDVADENLPENAGSWRVRIEGGKASVSRGAVSGPNTVKLHARALAAFYSGFTTPQHLRSIGRLEGDDKAVLAAAAAFAGGPPSLQDMF